MIKIGPLGGKLIFWGAALFLIGLIQGVLIPYFLNSRMALSAHLAAVQSGMALILFGVIWELLNLNKKWLIIVYRSCLMSMYFIWLAITLSAILGASKALPIVGQGYTASHFVEIVTSTILYIGSGLGIFSSLLIVFGLSRYARIENV